MLIIFLTGLVASMAHVVTGPDHLAAVTPLAIDSRKRSWVIGFSWGLGHTIGMLLIGLVFILFKEFISVDIISKHSDTIIGFLLIGVGSWAIVRTYRGHTHTHRPHPHFHTHPSLYAHIHAHSHDEVRDHDHVHPGIVKQNAFTALFIGIVHGFAGFSHLFALLPALALPTIWESVAYVSAFAIGTIITMILFAFILGFVAFQSFIRKKEVFLKWFTYAGGFIAIGIGVLWIVHPF
jgi:ABC-type nickel/cobalt efflux system permease component RcnA